MSENGLYYALSTIAQCGAALAALIGFLGLWQLDRLRDEWEQAERDLRGIAAIRMGTMEAQGRHIDEIVPVVEKLAAQPRDDGRERQIAAKADGTLRRRKAIPGMQRRLMRVLKVFLFVTLAVILAPAIVGLVFVNALLAWAWTPRLIGAASVWLAGAPVYVIGQAARSSSRISCRSSAAWSGRR